MTPMLQRVDLGDVAARTAFAAFGSAVNARNAHHLPRPIAQEMALLNPVSNPWLTDRAVAAWLVRDGADGPVVGRMAAMCPAEEAQGEACLGLYEAEDDPRVAHLLIDAGIGWLAGRGASRVLAPVDFSIFHGYRCQTGGFDEPPFIGEPRNPAYYGGHFDALGFVPLHRWKAMTLTGHTPPPPWPPPPPPTTMPTPRPWDTASRITTAAPPRRRCTMSGP